jgi:hypothetical protein
VSLREVRFLNRVIFIERTENMLSILASVLILVVALVDGQFNNPPGVDIWCGKAYRETYVFCIHQTVL